MRPKSVYMASAVAAIAITIAVAAGRPPVERPDAEAALKAKIAELRAEVARLRAERGVQETPSLRPVDAPFPVPEPPVLLDRRSRAEGRRGLQAPEASAAYDENPALLREMLEGADAGMKSRALSQLKSVGGADSVALAAGVLQGDGPEWLRAQAAGVLGDLGDAAALAPLLDASRAGDLQVRAGAAGALDRLGHAAPLQELIVTLAEMLDHPDGRMREDAVDLLSTFRTPAVFPTLAKALGDRTNSRIREAAADALGHTRRSEAVPYLEGALSDPEPRVRGAAQHALDAIRTAGK